MNKGVTGLEDTALFIRLRLKTSDQTLHDINHWTHFGRYTQAGIFWSIKLNTIWRSNRAYMRLSLPGVNIELMSLFDRSDFQGGSDQFMNQHFVSRIINLYFVKISNSWVIA